MCWYCLGFGEFWKRSNSLSDAIVTFESFLGEYHHHAWSRPQRTTSDGRGRCGRVSGRGRLLEPRHERIHPQCRLSNLTRVCRRSSISIVIVDDVVVVDVVVEVVLLLMIAPLDLTHERLVLGLVRVELGHQAGCHVQNEQKKLEKHDFVHVVYFCVCVFFI